jgi:hypothetical protein
MQSSHEGHAAQGQLNEVIHGMPQFQKSSGTGSFAFGISAPARMEQIRLRMAAGAMASMPLVALEVRVTADWGDAP